MVSCMANARHVRNRMHVSRIHRVHSATECLQIAERARGHQRLQAADASAAVPTVSVGLLGGFRCGRHVYGQEHL